METFENVVSALGIFAACVEPTIRSYGSNAGKPTGAHFTIADRDWTLSVQWGEGNYSGIGRGHEDEYTFEAALWTGEGGTENWIPMTEDRIMGFGVEPMAWVTLEEIASAMLRLLVEGPPVRTVSEEDTF